MRSSLFQAPDFNRGGIMNYELRVLVTEYIDKMLLKKIPLAGIVRVTGVSTPWLQNYVKNLYSQVSQQLEVTFKPTKKLTIECDEVWSFVNSKAQKQWKELALDVETKEIIGVYIGARNKESALKLWHSLPPVYRQLMSCRATARPLPCQCAVCYTDF